jgi:apolipoprotein N-acyltransferase
MNLRNTQFLKESEVPPMETNSQITPCSLRKGLLYAAGAVVSFYLAYASPYLGVLTVSYLVCLLQLSGLPTVRQAFYTALVTGFLAVAPQLRCFWDIFGPGAIVLWLVLAFWTALFVSLVRVCRLRLPRWAPILVPVLWTGLEYFRSEWYYLRFSWLNIGYAFAGHLPASLFGWLGMYGIGFMAAAVAAVLLTMRPVVARWIVLGIVSAFGAGLVLHAQSVIGSRPNPGSRPLAVAGVQLEFPSEPEVRVALDKLLAPEAQLLVLSEYTFLDTVPEKIKRWCAEHRRFLIVGGKEPAPGGNFYNTAFVIGTNGEVVFRQVKSVPIQFFKDGLPAPEQKLWESPWGPIGICVCYDLSYTRVCDELVRLGAKAMIVPTMDVSDWGFRQHELHARVAPVRAAEYGIPIFRLASSGISQVVDRTGGELARAGFPGDGEMIRGSLNLGKAGSRPLDRWLAPTCTWATGVICVWLLVAKRLQSFAKQ